MFACDSLLARTERPIKQARVVWKVMMRVNHVLAAPPSDAAKACDAKHLGRFGSCRGRHLYKTGTRRGQLSGAGCLERSMRARASGNYACFVGLRARAGVGGHPGANDREGDRRPGARQSCRTRTIRNTKSHSRHCYPYGAMPACHHPNG